MHDLIHGKDYPAQNNRVPEHRNGKRRESLLRMRRFSVIPDLHKFGVGYKIRPSPEPREEIDAQDPAHDPAPPVPVPLKASGPYNGRNSKRRIGGKTCRYDRRPGKPPVHLSACHEILKDTL